MTKNLILSLFFILTFTVSAQRREYFGLEPPTGQPLLFAKDIISTDSAEHSAPAFSNDGKLVLWSPLARGPYPVSFLLETRKEKGKWLIPYRPSFADTAADDLYPVFSPDGKTLYFSSRRGLPNESSPRKPQGLRIWMVERVNSRWGAPLPVDTTVFSGTEYAHSISASGTIYFSSTRSGGRGSFDIFLSRKIHGNYQSPEHLKNDINTSSYEDGPCIAPDESFLIFESDRPGGVSGSIDLYISFRQKDGSWGKPKNMGPKLNSKYTERFARLSPDGKYLFFGSTRGDVIDKKWGEALFDVYWIDAKVINELSVE